MQRNATKLNSTQCNAMKLNPKQCNTKQNQTMTNQIFSICHALIQTVRTPMLSALLCLIATSRIATCQAWPTWAICSAKLHTHTNRAHSNVFWLAYPTYSGLLGSMFSGLLAPILLACSVQCFPARLFQRFSSCPRAHHNYSFGHIPVTNLFRLYDHQFFLPHTCHQFLLTTCQSSSWLIMPAPSTRHYHVRAIRLAYHTAW